MDTQLFVVTISCYLVSLIAALLAAFFNKSIPVKIGFLLVALHLLFLVAWFFTKDQLSVDSGLVSTSKKYFFLACCCSAIIAGGIFLRKKVNLILKIYLGLYLATVLIFIFSPSRVLGWVSSGSFKTIEPIRFHLKENYYLVEQQGLLNSSANQGQYKLIREMGMFHKTLARNIVIPNLVDSIRMMEFKENTSVRIKCYFHKDTIVGNSDQIIILDNPNSDPNTIEHRVPSK